MAELKVETHEGQDAKRDKYGRARRHGSTFRDDQISPNQEYYGSPLNRRLMCWCKSERRIGLGYVLLGSSHA